MPGRSLRMRLCGSTFLGERVRCGRGGAGRHAGDGVGGAGSGGPLWLRSEQGARRHRVGRPVHACAHHPHGRQRFRHRALLEPGLRLRGAVHREHRRQCGQSELDVDRGHSPVRLIGPGAGRGFPIVVRAIDSDQSNVTTPLTTRTTPITAAPIVAAGRPLRPIQALNRLIVSWVPSGAKM